MDKTYQKVEKYLKEIFPKKALIRYSQITDENAEFYGFNGMKILVVEKNSEIFYQLITESNPLSVELK